MNSLPAIKKQAAEKYAVCFFWVVLKFQVVCVLLFVSFGCDCLFVLIDEVVGKGGRHKFVGKGKFFFVEVISVFIPEIQRVYEIETSQSVLIVIDGKNYHSAYKAVLFDKDFDISVVLVGVIDANAVTEFEFVFLFILHRALHM